MKGYPCKLSPASGFWLCYAPFQGPIPTTQALSSDRLQSGCGLMQLRQLLLPASNLSPDSHFYFLPCTVAHGGRAVNTAASLLPTACGTCDMFTDIGLLGEKLTQPPRSQGGLTLKKSPDPVLTLFKPHLSSGVHRKVDAQ